MESRLCDAEHVQVSCTIVSCSIVARAWGRTYEVVAHQASAQYDKSGAAQYDKKVRHNAGTRILGETSGELVYWVHKSFTPHWMALQGFFGKNGC